MGKRIRQLRKAQGYSNHEKFAFSHDIDRTLFGHYERGKDLRFSSLLKIIYELGMTPEEFFSEGFD